MTKKQNANRIVPDNNKGLSACDLNDMLSLNIDINVSIYRNDEDKYRLPNPISWFQLRGFQAGTIHNIKTAYGWILPKWNGLNSAQVAGIAVCRAEFPDNVASFEGGTVASLSATLLNGDSAALSGLPLRITCVTSIKSAGAMIC